MHVLFLLACHSKGPGGETSDGAPIDVDGDGFDASADCDDGNPSVHPQADEHCDGVDTNCDGELDGAIAVEATPWYADADADGFGNPFLSRVACSAPSFFVADATDCDDADDQIHPGATEYCDGTDDDCDGASDEGDAVDQTIVYTDADGDGFGNPTAPTTACPTTAGVSTDATDCDDTNAAVNPVGVEVCNNALDDDCDGTAIPCGFEGDKTLDLADTAIVGNGDDRIGYLSAGGDVDGDGVQDVAVRGGRSDAYGSGDAGTVYVVPGPLAGTIDASAALASFEVAMGTTSTAPIGDAVALEDVDGDGTDDMIAGSTGAGGAERGVYVWMAPFGGAFDADSADAAITTSAVGNEGIGGSLAELGDVDEDGTTDFAVADIKGGEVYVVLGPIDHDIAADSSSVILTGVCDGSGYGCSMGGFGTGLAGNGDLDGDGALDLVVGAPSYSEDSGGYGVTGDEGRAFVFSGPLDSSVDGTAAIATIAGTREYGYFGTAIEIAHDIDGDGYDDLAWGSGYAESYYVGSADPGRAGVFYGPISGELTLEDADFLVEGDGGDATGNSIAVSDTDADGTLDLLVGDPNEDGDVAKAGAVFVLPGPIGTGTMSTSDATGRLVGVSADAAGYSVRDVGDLNGDAIDDIAIGAPSYQVSVADQGAVFFVFGGGM